MKPMKKIDIASISSEEERGEAQGGSTKHQPSSPSPRNTPSGFKKTKDSQEVNRNQVINLLDSEEEDEEKNEPGRALEDLDDLSVASKISIDSNFYEKALSEQVYDQFCRKSLICWNELRANKPLRLMVPY